MNRKLAVVCAAVLAVSFVAPVSWADPLEPSETTAAVSDKSVQESPTGSYLVVLRADPLLKTMSADDLDSAAAKAKGAALDASHDEVLADSGIATTDKVQDYRNALNGFSARLDYAEAVRVAANPKVATVRPDELRQPTSAPDDRTPSQVERNNLYQFLGLSGRGEAWDSGITGEGVVVGVIDTGIWPEHPSFADDGSYTPLATPLDESERSSCAFGNTAANPDDAPFTCNNKLIGARDMLDSYRALVGADADEFQSARDDDGHGTHTASTAAGNANITATIFGRFKGTVSGIAPRAQIIAYKALGNLGGFTSDLVHAIDTAVADGVDVINYSIGGGATTVAEDTLAFLFAADAGIFSAVSAGNDGPDAATIGGPSDVPWVTSVGANTQFRFYDGYIRLSNGTTYRGASVTHGTAPAQFVDAADAGGEFCQDGTLDPAKVTGKIVLCLRGGNGRIAKSFAVKNAGGIGMVLYNQTDVDTLFTDNMYVPTVMVDYSAGLAIKNYIASTPSPTGRLAGGAIGNSPFYAPTMANFSSRGPNPTSGDIIKPDITAPGVQILAGASPFPNPGEEAPGQLFQAIAGTSMSSPVVAGLYALLKQAHPDWTAAMAKSALMTTANTKVRDNDRVSQATPFAMGSGMARPGKPGSRGSAFNPGLVYDAGFYDYLGFLCDEGREAFVDADATCSTLAGAGIATSATDLNYPSIGDEAVPGSVTVTRTVTSVADSTLVWKALTTDPDGYTVSVSPAELTLAPGDSASFEVTITNDGSGPAGEWRFGSLNWVAGGGPTIAGYAQGGYNVRSPIAVQGVTLEAPTQLFGSGTEGDGDFQVHFGYSGTYTAGAHGLVAPIDTTDTISQDPDQTYPSADDGVGVDLIPVTLSGVALARWSLVIPGDPDIDLYLLDSTGTVVAQSTNGGTDETIELVAPTDGDYTMVVHGWSVPSSLDPLTYTLQNWLVPLTPGGGSLSITSGETTTAVIGATHTVGVAWTGLTAGVTYLGAVSHSNSSGLLGLTLINITG